MEFIFPGFFYCAHLKNRDYILSNILHFINLKLNQNKCYKINVTSEMK